MHAAHLNAAQVQQSIVALCAQGIVVLVNEQREPRKGPVESNATSQNERSRAGTSASFTVLVCCKRAKGKVFPSSRRTQVEAA